MRTVVLSTLVIFLLVLACGCQQVRCAADGTVSAVGGAWRSVRTAFTPEPRPGDTTCARLSDEVYSHPCGGDNGIGRGGTGAFRVP